MGIFRVISGFFNHWVIRTISRLLMVFFLGIMGLHVFHTWETREDAGDYVERVLVIQSEWYFKALNPIAGDVLGFSLPAFPVAYVSGPAVERAGADIQGVRVHEAKHLEQRDEMGIQIFLRTAEWKLEGMAEYARGAPTVDVCNPDPNARKVRLAYREFFVVVSYLIEGQGLTEDEVYLYPDFPLAEAEAWLEATRCAE